MPGAWSEPLAEEAFPLSLALYLPERLRVEEEETGRIQFQLEIRNDSERVWEARPEDRPRLEVRILDVHGVELTRTARLFPTLAYPVRLATGRGLLFAVSAFLPPLSKAAPRPETVLRVEVQLLPFGLVAEKSVRITLGPSGTFRRLPAPIAG